MIYGKYLKIEILIGFKRGRPIFVKLYTLQNICLFVYEVISFQ